MPEKRAGARQPDSPGPVLLMAGSPSDLDCVLECEETLASLGISSAIRVSSAHRTPEDAAECARGAESQGFRVIIAFAGLAAHLAGVCAAHSQLPVIAVPLGIGPLRGVDAALASLQMPPGTPLAAVAIDGGRNAALLAARILALHDADLRSRLGRLSETARERYEPERVAQAIETQRKERARRGKI
jgi:5-(carboxyamino)imidazole ribonucleotide mutase